MVSRLASSGNLTDGRCGLYWTWQDGRTDGGHLVKSGHHVSVYNRSAARAKAWADSYDGIICATPAEAASNADYVFTCVGNDSDLEEVVCGPVGVLSSMRGDAFLIDHTTTSAHVVDVVERASVERGVQFLDAPVSGGEAGAIKGELSIMVGGNKAAFDQSLHVLKSYGKRVVHMGVSGAGQRTKMANQICIAGVIQALAEAVAFAENAQLDMAKVLHVIAGGAGQSWQLDNRGATMHERRFDFGFSVDLMRKDLGLCRDEASRNGSQLPMTSVIDEFYAELQHRGAGHLDTSSLIELLATTRGRP